MSRGAFYWKAGAAAVFALRACAYIGGSGGVLVPDSFSYAEGGSAWSSPISATAGAVYGMRGVVCVGVVGALALGWFVGDACSRDRRALIPGVVLFVFPFGMQASPDALGAAAACAYWRYGWRTWGIPLVAAAHLQAALVAITTVPFKRWSGVWLIPLAGSAGSMVGQGMLGWFHAQQVRYFVVGFAGCAVLGAMKHFSVSDSGGNRISRGTPPGCSNA